MQTIELEHEWTKQKVTVRVERITTQKVTVSFQIVGTSHYELDLRTNKMRSTSAAVRRKHPFCLWRAADIEAVQRAVWIHLHPEQDGVKKSFERHMDNMPYRNHREAKCH